MRILRPLVFLLTVLVWLMASPWVMADVSTLKKGVVKVMAEFSHAKQTGTGFVVGKGKKHFFIVTASHVIERAKTDDLWENATSIQVTFFTHQEESLTAEVVQKEGGNPKGLALLKVGGALPDDVEVLDWDTESRLQGGEEVQLIGFPLIAGTPWAVTKGTLSGFHGPILKFSGAIEEGNSGGPLFYRGKVIGVVVEVTGQFGEAKPSQIAQFTVENWPGFTRHDPELPSSIVVEKEPSNGVGQGIDRISPFQFGHSGSKMETLASLVISTIPQDAQVFVDEELIGQTTTGPVTIPDLIPDEYEVMVKKPGFRTWIQHVDLLSGERRELTASLQKGAELNVSGLWINPNEPALSYVLQQTGERVIMKELTKNLFGTVVTAEGEGQLQGNQLEVFYRTALGTMGQSSTTLSDDGQRLTGTFQDFTSMVPMTISLVRTGDVPASMTFPGNEAWRAIQELGQ